MTRKCYAFRLAFLLSLFAALLSTQNPAAQPIAAVAQAKHSELRLAGLRSDVTVRRDDRGTPYIEAANEEDLYFAQGFVTAGDRLWQMDLLRRTGRGELSEIFGRVTLEEDRRRRIFGFGALADQMVGRLSQPARAAIEAYARGVNALIESLDEKSLPPEFRALQYKPHPWRPADSLIIGKIFAESLNTTWRRDLMRGSFSTLPQERRDALLPVTSPLDVIMVGSDNSKKKTGARNRSANSMIRPPGHRTLLDLAEIADTARRSLERVGLYAEDLAASNNWVVSGRRSVTGKPLLANDPHLQASAPSIWHMAHLSAPELRVAGVTVAGMPGILIGHNDRIAWGLTNVEADVQDLYLEEFDKENPQRYLTPAGWREAEIRREEIKARKTPTGSETESVEHHVTVTRHGPIVFEQDGARYALAWPALDPTSIELEVYFWIARSRNWKEFRSAISRYNGFPLNYIYADVDGRIGYWAAGRYPIRKSGEGIVPHDGKTEAGDWKGYLPFDTTPHVYDPPSGVIVTANNRVVGLDYPYYITHDWASPYRARRIYSLLNAKEKLSAEDFRAIQADTYSFPDATFAAEVVKIGKSPSAASPEWREIVAAFDGWDGMMKAESQVAPLCFLMRETFQQKILAGALGPELARRYGWANSGAFFDLVITTRAKEWLPREFDSYEALLLACYKDAREKLTKRLGADKSLWTWGRLTPVNFPHPLAGVPGAGERFAVAPTPQNGGDSTVNRGRAVSMRFIADTSDWDKTRMGIPLGESGDPASPHWKDQYADWQTANPRVFAFSKNAILGGTKETLVLLAPGPASTSPSPGAEAAKVFPHKYSIDDFTNGLRLITAPTEYPNLVALYIVVSAGSRNEVEQGKSGFAHLFEHLMFRGTERFTSEKYDEIMKKVGADRNAYTSDDRTVYHTVFSKDNLERVMELEADRFQNLKVPVDLFKTEAKAVLGEYNKNASNPVNKLYEALRDMAFVAHTYKHTTRGYLQDVENLPNQYDYSLEFFSRYYRPEYTTIIVVGDVNRENVLTTTRKYWGEWKRGGFVIQIPAEPEQRQERTAYVDWPNPTSPYLAVAYKGPAFSAEEKDMASMELIGNLGFSEGSSLYQRLVAKEQKVDTLTYDFEPHRDQYLLTVIARVKERENVDYVKNEIVKTFESFKTSETPKIKLEAVKSNLKYSFALRLNSSDAIARTLAPYIALSRTPETINRLFDTYSVITPDDLRAMAARYFIAERRTVVFLSNKERE